MEFAVDSLPSGLKVDATIGRITGSIDVEGHYVVALRARNALGAAERPLTIVVGDRIALTPPLGWNSWNCWAGRVTQERVAAAARAIVTHQLREHGWSYVNVDDGWQGIRGGPFNAIQPNTKFPDMKGLADEIHALGLKFGLYSTPWRTTFSGQIGSSADYANGSYDWIKAGTHNEFFKYRIPKERSKLEEYAWLKPLAERRRERRHETITRQLRTFGKYSFVAQDVKQWADWGVDYLKYDWVPNDLEHTGAMRRELDRPGRDIVYSLANNASFSIGPALANLANAWRTTADLKDTWRHVSEIGFSRDKWAPFNAPGRYNDPDILVIGHVGAGQPEPTRLTSDEQYTHVSLWCLLSGPLLLGCDLEKLDAFTLGLITNDEVLDINQDSLCKQGTRVAQSGEREVYAKLLEDGSWAVGLFNRGEKPASMTLRWPDIGIAGKQTVRDLWRQQDLGIFADQFQSQVAPHGVVLVRLTPVVR